MKSTTLTIFFALSLFFMGWVSPSPVSANEKKAATLAAERINKPPVATEKKQKGILEELFPSIGTRLWNPSISGNVKVAGTPHQGNELHLDDTLGLKMQDSAATQADEVGLTPQDGKLRLNFEYYKLDGTKTFATPANFQNTTYGAGESVQSELRLKYLTAKWLPTYSSKGDSNASFLFELVYFGQKQRVNGNLQGEQIHDFDGIIPAIGYRVETGREGKLIYYAEASIYPGSQYYYNGETGIIKLFGKLALGAGYRVCAQKITSDQDYLEFKAAGPFFQAVYKF